MRAETPRQERATVGYTGPWTRTCEDLARLLANSLNRQHPAGEAEVTVLGARDEFSVPPITPEPAWRTPVRLYGHQVIVGPYPEDGRISPCPRCLAQRWQGGTPWNGAPRRGQPALRRGPWHSSPTLSPP